MPDTTADTLVMLLSTDWFLPYWSTIGIEAKKRKDCIQQGCREIVRHMIAGAEEYYLISFSEDRVNATREALQALAAKCGLDSASSERIAELSAPRPERHWQETTAWLLTVALDELLQDDQLEASIKATLQRAKANFSFDDLDFEQLCMNSRSQWDAYIRQLTPELPTSLSNWIAVAVLAEAKLDCVLRELNAEQQQHLLARFRGIAKSITRLDNDRLPHSW